MSELDGAGKKLNRIYGWIWDGTITVLGLIRNQAKMQVGEGVVESDCESTGCDLKIREK